MNKAARIQDAADRCRENAAQTVVDKLGLAATQALSFNDYENAVVEECLSQAACFADEHRVATADVLRALHIG